MTIVLCEVAQSNSQSIVLRPDLGSLEKELEEAGEKVQQKIQTFADADDSQSMLQINSEYVRLKHYIVARAY